MLSSQALIDNTRRCFLAGLSMTFTPTSILLTPRGFKYSVKKSCSFGGAGVQTEIWRGAYLEQCFPNGFCGKNKNVCSSQVFPHACLCLARSGAKGLFGTFVSCMCSSITSLSFIDILHFFTLN